MKQRFSEGHIIEFLREAEAGMAVKDLWRNTFGGQEASNAKRLKALELENARLERLLAEALLEQAVTREGLRKTWSAHQLVGRWCAGSVTEV